MTVKADKLPGELALVRVIDEEAQAAIKRAQAHVAPIVSAETPRGRTGSLARAMKPKVAKTSTGARLTIQAPRGKRNGGQATIADIARWVTRGTGLYRTTGLENQRARRIRSSRPLGRMTLPGGRKVWSVKGQRPNPFLDRVQQRAGRRVEEILEQGADQAARAVERKLA